MDEEQREENATEPFSITKGQGHVRAPDQPRHRHVISHCVCSLCTLVHSDVDKVGVVFEFH